MSAQDDGGGSAFPIHGGTKANGFPIDAEPGMSLRDYFAAKALQGVIACFKDHSGATSVPARCAKAYEYADAMLKARAA